MDVVKFIKAKERMCKKYNECCNCPVSHYNNGSEEGCEMFFKSNTEKYVEIIEKWSTENPIKTRQSEFLKMFSNASIGVNGALTICPCHIDTKFKTEICGISKCEDCRKEYWLAEVE